MVAPTEIFSTITTSQTDADSPVDTVLMSAYRGNLINLNEQMIGPSTAPTYVAAQAHDHDGVNSAPIVLKTYSSGAHAIFRSTVQSTGNNNIIYADQLTVGLPFAGTLRIRYDLKGETTAAVNAVGNIFRNGSAVGTESSVVLTSTDFVTFTEDIAGWSVNDILQIRARISTGATGVSTAIVKNLVLSASTVSISQIALTVPAPATT